VPVQCVVSDIGFAADKPFEERRAAVVEHLFVRLKPVDQFACAGIPIGLGICERLAAQVEIVGHVCAGDCLGRRLVQFAVGGRNLDSLAV